MRSALSINDFLRVPHRWARHTVLVALSWMACAWGLWAEESMAAVPGIETAFESRVMRLAAPAGQAPGQPLEVSWTYVNHWDFPLLIERFEESCTCLRGRPEVDAVEPGKSKVIRANFSAGSYRGLVRKSLHVRFVGHAESVELVAEIEIPLSVQLSRHDLVWQRAAGDSNPSVQTVDITAGTEVDFRITDLRGVMPSEYAIQTDTLVEGRHYRLTITPAATAAIGTRCLQIRTDSPEPRDRVLALFLRTEAPPAAAETSTHPKATGP